MAGNSEHPKLYIVGLGNTPPVENQLLHGSKAYLSENDGKFSDARTNIGLNTARTLATELGLPPFSIEPATFSKDEESESWIASTQATVEKDGAFIDITIAYPGNDVAKAGTTLVPWIHEKQIDPSKLLVIVEDDHLAPGECDITMVGLRAHEGYGSITGEYANMVPAVRVGVDVPKDSSDASKTPWDFSDPVKKRAASFLADNILHLADTDSSSSPYTLDLPKDPSLKDAALHAVTYWRQTTAQDVAAIKDLEEQVSYPVFPVPLFLPRNIIEQKIHPAIDSLTKLSYLLLSEYKKGDPHVQMLLHKGLEKVGSEIVDLYKFQQFPGEPERVSMGFDNCWDFMITNDGNIQLTEGDRNGGGRTDLFLLSQYHLNRVKEGLGDKVTEARVQNLRDVVTREYEAYCKANAISPKDTPTLMMMVGSDFANLEQVNTLKGLKELQTLRTILAPVADAYPISDESLVVDKDGSLKAKTYKDGVKDVDILVHLISPTMMNPENYKPAVDAITQGTAKTLLLGDPAKDLVYLNKPLFALLKDAKLMEQLFADEGNPNYSQIRELSRRVRDIIPYQLFIDETNVDELKELAGNFYIKAFSFTRFAGKGTAGPSDIDMANEIFSAIKQGETKGTAIAPVKNIIAHPLYPNSRAEIRVWQSNASKVHEDPDVDLYANHTHYIRVGPPGNEKVNISRISGGGDTTIISV